MKIYQSWYIYLSRVAINRFHLKLFLTSTLQVKVIDFHQMNCQMLCTCNGNAYSSVNMNG